MIGLNNVVANEETNFQLACHIEFFCDGSHTSVWLKIWTYHYVYSTEETFHFLSNSEVDALVSGHEQMTIEFVIAMCFLPLALVSAFLILSCRNFSPAAFCNSEKGFTF